MNGNFTRDTTAQGRSKKYSRLLMQQGRIAVDADWNEQVERERELTRQAVRDAVGHCGVPRDLPGFAVGAGGAGGFTLSAGRLYADGMLLELDADLALAHQPFGSATIADVADGARSLVWLECRERLQTALDDERQREVALGGPDTMVRVQTVWCVRVAPIADLGMSEPQILDAIVERRRLDPPDWAPTTGLLRAAASVATVDADGRPCLLPPTAGYTDQLNSLYRVEIHSAGDETSARYKWSRRNASIRGVIRQSGGRLDLVGTDANEAILTGNWVEVQSPEQLRLDQPGQLSRITIGADRAISFDPVPPLGGAGDGAVVTLWDQAPGESADGLPLHTAPQLLESGVGVEFSQGTYAEGEYWLIPARAATGDIEWPPVFGGPEAVRPFNRGPWFCPLALVTRNGVTVSNVRDLRVEFPPLTAIRASDVSYDSTIVDVDGAVNVQEAIERLMRQRSGACTLHAAPGLGWESVFDQIGTGEDAEVCLEVGEYLLTDVLKVAAKGHIMLSGRGRGTHIIAPSHESAVQFIRCAGVTIRDLRVTAGTAPDTRRRSGRNGAIECRDCGPVVIEGVNARNRGQRPRSTACVSVIRSVSRRESRHAGRGDVAIRDCTFEAGLQQIGVQVINPRRAEISGNTIRSQPMQSSQVWRAFETSRTLRRDVADLLVAHRRSGDADDHASVDDLQISQTWTEREFVFRNHRVSAVADPEVADRVDAYLDSVRLDGMHTTGDLSTHIRNQLMEALAKGGQVRFRSQVIGAGNAVTGFDLLGNWVKNIRTEIQSHISQGIVVAGRSADLVDIRDNEVSDAIQGIHVGFSHRGQEPNDRDTARRISIVANTVTVATVPVARARHGIFCGNVESLRVNDNHIRRARTSPTLSKIPLNGIHVHGFAGPFMQVKNNDVRGATTGVRFVPDYVKGSSPLWLVEDNLFRSAVHTVDVPAHLVSPAVAALVRRSENNVTG